MNCLNFAAVLADDGTASTTRRIRSLLVIFPRSSWNSITRDSTILISVYAMTVS